MVDEPVPAAAPKRFPVKTLVLLVVVMGMEAGAFLLWSKVSHGPKHAEAAEHAPVADKVVESNVEVKVIELRCPNSKSGKTYLYDLEIVVECPKDKAALVKLLTQEREATVSDSIGTIVRKAEPQHLQEPELETLRRQIKAALDDVYGEGAVMRVLIPRCTPYRADY